MKRDMFRAIIFLIMFYLLLDRLSLAEEDRVHARWVQTQKDERMCMYTTDQVESELEEMWQSNGE